MVERQYSVRYSDVRGSGVRCSLTAARAVGCFQVYGVVGW